MWEVPGGTKPPCTKGGFRAFCHPGAGAQNPPFVLGGVLCYLETSGHLGRCNGEARMGADVRGVGETVMSMLDAFDQAV